MARLSRPKATRVAEARVSAVTHIKRPASPVLFSVVRVLGLWYRERLRASARITPAVASNSAHEALQARKTLWARSCR